MDNKLTFCIASDLFQYGVGDDGQPFIGEFYYIQAEDDYGNRWNHHHRFHGCAPCQVDDGDGTATLFQDVRADAYVNATRLLDRIQQTGDINLAYWDEARPAYGSPAYQDYGVFNDLMQEYNDRMGA